MFQGKNASTSYGKMVVDVKIVTINMNIVGKCCYQKDNHKRASVLRERTMGKKNFYELEKKGEIKKDDDRHHTKIKKAHITNEGSFASMEGWNTTWLGMSNMTPFLETSKPRESIVSQSKLISIEEKIKILVDKCWKPTIF
jgi:hypothetical protein